jgi:farnesyl-diphosphate farnesyltransferase
MDHHNMLRRVSRTFALSIELLPYVLRESMTLSYLLLRVSDCLEDHADIPAEQKPELLRLWAKVLNGSAAVEELTEKIAYLNPENDFEVQAAQQAGHYLELVGKLPADLQKIVLNRVEQTSLGMARWQAHGPFVEDEEAMDDYMHQVAGLVGYLLTEIFAWYSPRIQQRFDQLMPLAREYGLALQTVNIIRGMRKDYERGWVYVPRSLYEKYGLTREGLFAPENVDKALLVVNALADKASKHLFNGINFIIAFPRHQHRIRLACMWPLFFAIKTLAVSKNNVNVILQESKLSREQVKKIMRDTSVFGWSNHWISHYYKQLSLPRWE